MKPWFLAGSHPQDYAISTELVDGKQCGRLASTASQPGGFGTLMQGFKADVYHGKRMRLTGTVKTIDVHSWAGLWMRVDPTRDEPLAFDNMRDRPLSGTTDWQTYEVVLDVPVNATRIAFGILLRGSGQVWLSEVRFEEVDDTVLVTANSKAADRPGNLDFSAA
ncbi:hypothetical protein [Ktedonobacter robiniae]|uniref:Transcriptional regulator n=1 Tax=Ktedonobacter robiniae TaxID=2778365 RepID=A0ABQ3UI34_9CHLR|nr:hypothetical protein [Ktedonobacter robiniae]GHO52376.1 hypothetical protein KSB_08510 [Ktedonobacter robiniae]